MFVSKAMADVFAQAASVKKNDNVNVLINGPTGSGKEMVAEAIGKGSKKYFAVNCAALTDTLLESELFGHEKGAFTGAHARKPGLFELADGGSLFLDEVGCLSKKAQESLLRVVQSGELKRVGGTATIKVKVRVICATNHDLEAQVAAGTFREDLLERLATRRIKIPPLADRREDIKPLVLSFAEKLGRPGLSIDPTCLDYLEKQDWPRNVRQLENAIKHMIEQCAGSELEVADLPPRLADDSTSPNESRVAPSTTMIDGGEPSRFVFEDAFGTGLDEILDRCAIAYIRATASQRGGIGSIRRLAEELRLPYTNLHRRLLKYGLVLEPTVAVQRRDEEPNS